MNTTSTMSTHRNWASGLISVGYVAVLIGAIDPLEGSAIVVIGSGLILLGTWVSNLKHSQLVYRATCFALMTFGIATMWILSVTGGIGIRSGRSPWWAILIAPYAIGWLMAIWERGLPRWVYVFGIGVGLWYLALGGTAVTSEQTKFMSIIAMIGLFVVVGCIGRLKRNA